jgi:hypothetical protein
MADIAAPGNAYSRERIAVHQAILEFCAEVIAEEDSKFVEVAVGVDITDFGNEGFGIDEFVEGHETVFHLSNGGDHEAIETFFDECDVGTDAEASTEHDVIGVGAGATSFVTELNTVDFDFGHTEFFEAFHDHFGDEMSKMDIAEGNVAVFVTGGCFKEVEREFFGKGGRWWIAVEKDAYARQFLPES